MQEILLHYSTCNNEKWLNRECCWSQMFHQQKRLVFVRAFPLIETLTPVTFCVQQFLITQRRHLPLNHTCNSIRGTNKIHIENTVFSLLTPIKLLENTIGHRSSKIGTIDKKQGAMGNFRSITILIWETSVNSSNYRNFIVSPAFSYFLSLMMHYCSSHRFSFRECPCTLNLHADHLLFCHSLQIFCSLRCDSLPYVSLHCNYGERNSIKSTSSTWHLPSKQSSRLEMAADRRP